MMRDAFKRFICNDCLFCSKDATRDNMLFCRRFPPQNIMTSLSSRKHSINYEAFYPIMLIGTVACAEFEHK